MAIVLSLRDAMLGRLIIDTLPMSSTLFYLDTSCHNITEDNVVLTVVRLRMHRYIFRSNIR